MSRKDRITGLTFEPIMPGTRAKQDFFEASLTQKYEIGTRYVLDDGRVFRYAKNGAAALNAGELQSSAAFGGSVGTIQSDLTVVAAGIGATSVFVTTATDATSINQWAGGYLAVGDGGSAIGQGEMYKIVSNEAGAAGSLRFDLDRPLTTAWTTSSKVTLQSNLYNLIVQSPVTTAIGMPVGVSMVAVPINYYCWVQTWGVACCLVKLAMNAFAANVLTDLTAAGSVGIDDGALINATIGMTGVATATTDSGIIFLTISP